MALALGVLAIPIILLYLLRLRRREQVVSSTLLWQQLVSDRAANAPWQKLRRNILMFLQLLALAALIFSLARPYFKSAGRLDGDLIILMDVSASMTTREDENDGRRFDETLDQVKRLVNDLNSPDTMTLITVGSTPIVLAASTSDKDQIRQMLDGIEPELSRADWLAAFSLASASTQGQLNPKIVIISDGGLPDDLPPLPGAVTFIPVGRNTENLAITALGTRPSSATQELLVSAENFGQEAGLALLNLYADGQLIDSRQIETLPGEALHQSWSLPDTAQKIEVRLEPIEGTADFLAVDNQAWLVRDNLASRRILLIGEGNLFLERLFSVLPGIEITRSNSFEMDNFTAEDSHFNLVIFDGVPLPTVLPAANILVFDPQPTDSINNETPPITVSGTFTNTTAVRLVDDPLLTDVDWHNIAVAEARMVTAPSLQSLIDAEGGSLLMAGEIDGRRVAIFPFDLADSDLPLQIAFPIIMANIVDWLNPGRVSITADNIQPGGIVTLFSNPRANSVTVELPNGELWVDDSQSISEPILFNETGQVGIYTVTIEEATGVASEFGQFAVNFFFPDESRIVPVTDLSVLRTDQITIPAQISGQQEVWPIILGAGLVIMMVEWWLTYRRRIKPAPSK